MGVKRKPREIVIPRSTPLPNWIVDDLLPFEGVPGSAWRVLLFLWRKTVGWDRRGDYIPISQIMNGAGVGRHQAINAARLWEAVGLFRRSRAQDRRGTNRFTVNLDISGEEVCRRMNDLTIQALEQGVSLQRLVLFRHSIGAVSAPDLVSFQH